MWLLVLLMTSLIGVGLGPTAAFSIGAPDTACGNMIPGHGTPPQSSDTSFTVIANQTEVSNGQRVQVTMGSPSGDPFKGFMIRAQDANNSETRGTFISKEHKFLTCGAGFNNAATHKDSTVKDVVKIDWEAPKEFTGSVVFKGTFLTSFAVFWVNVTSEKLSVVKREAPAPTPALTLAPTSSPSVTGSTTAANLPAVIASETTSASDGAGVSGGDLNPASVGNEVINVVESPVDVAADKPVEASTPASPTFSNSTSAPSTTPSEGDPPSDSASSVSSSPTSTTAPETTAKPKTKKPPGRRRFGLLNKFRTTPKPVKKETTTVATTTVPSVAPVFSNNATGSRLLAAMDNIYFGCGNWKGCFGMPDGCESKESCNVVVAYSKVNDGFAFELLAKSMGYAAVGLSFDTLMGDDSVVACRNVDGRPDVVMTWNSRRGNSLLVNPLDGLLETEAATVDGSIFCKFVRQAQTETHGKVFDLDKNRFHIMIAKGELGFNGFLTHHDIRTVSSSTTNLAKFENLTASSDLFKMLHGCLLLAAWMALVPLATLLSRYYKTTWVNHNFCGIAQWFHWHRGLGILAWSLTLVGVGFIFYFFKGNWRPSVHSILGCIVTGLAFIQPFIAMLRCAPDSKNRPIFNWIHWFIGQSALIISMAAIFYGMEAYGTQTWVFWLLILFIAFHCLTHMVLSVGQCASDASSSKKSDIFPLKDLQFSPPAHGEEKRTDAPGSAFRRAILGVYILVVFAIAAIIIAAVVVEEDLLEVVGLI